MRMARNFRQFVAFSRDGLIGFAGKLRGKRTGRIYEVRIQVPAHGFPAQKPAVYMNPHPESHHWLRDGSLCVESLWVPGKTTFANTVLVVAKYIEDFDR